MGVVAPVRPLDLQSGADHRTVDVEGESATAGPPQGGANQFFVELREPFDVLAAEPLHPGARRSWRRQPRKAAEASQHRVALLVAQVQDAPAADQDQAQQSQNHRHCAEVGGGESRTHGAAEHGHKTGSLQVLPNQLQSGMRGDFLSSDSVLHVAVDTALQICSSRSHWEWPFVEGACDRLQPREYPIP